MPGTIGLPLLLLVVTAEVGNPDHSISTGSEETWYPTAENVMSSSRTRVGDTKVGYAWLGPNR